MTRRPLDCSHREDIASVIDGTARASTASAAKAGNPRGRARPWLDHRPAAATPASDGVVA